MTEIISVGWPRSGQTWLIRMLTDLGLSVQKTHMRPEHWDGEGQVVFIQRDPRDVACSLMHYRSLPMTDESLMRVIRTMTHTKWDDDDVDLVPDEVMGYFGFVDGWLKYDKVIHTSYEALQDDALFELAWILEKLGFKVDQLGVGTVRSVINGHSFDYWKDKEPHSVWRGKVGTWKEFFKQEHGKLIHDRLGELMRQYQYIDDSDWWKDLPDG